MGSLEYLYDLFGWLNHHVFRDHSSVGGSVVGIFAGGLCFLAVFHLWSRATEKYAIQHPQQAKSEVEFLPLYQAASTDTPDGGPNVSIWWIPVTLGSANKEPVPHATVKMKLHNADRISHSENQTLWWIDKQNKFNPEITLVPGRVHMISFVARRVPPAGDTRGWYGVLVEQNSSTYPERHKETVKLPAGQDYKLTVTVLANGKPLANNTYIVHVPPKGEHNTRFWVATEQTDNW